MQLTLHLYHYCNIMSTAFEKILQRRLELEVLRRKSGRKRSELSEAFQTGVLIVSLLSSLSATSVFFFSTCFCAAFAYVLVDCVAGADVVVRQVNVGCVALDSTHKFITLTINN